MRDTRAAGALAWGEGACIVGFMDPKMPHRASGAKQ
jgi:hypothetical protein